MMYPLPVLASVVMVGSAQAQTGGADQHLAQAELFARRGWYADADQELRSGLILPDGQEHFGLHWLAAQVAWELLDVERAWQMSQRAAELAPDPERQAAASALADSYATTFGYVDIQGPHDDLVSRLQVEPMGPIFDAELKRYVNRLSLSLRERTPLPIRIGLPVGSYRINGAEVTVAAGQHTELPLTMRDLGASGFAALQVTRLEAGLGVSLLTGGRVDNHRPALAGQLSLTQPIGPLLLGLVLGGRLDGYTAARNQVVGTLPTWDIGLRIGREIALVGPLSLRPSLQYRFGFVPGMGLACSPGDTAYVCVAEDETAALNLAPVAVFATSATHRPGVELALDYREAGRTTALGTGVKLILDQAFGQLAAQGEATIDNDQIITWTTDQRSWTATGVQMFGTFSFAF